MIIIGYDDHHDEDDDDRRRRPMMGRRGKSATVAARVSPPIFYQRHLSTYLSLTIVHRRGTAECSEMASSSMRLFGFFLFFFTCCFFFGDLGNHVFVRRRMWQRRCFAVITPH